MLLTILLATAILKHSRRLVKWILDTHGLSKRTLEAPNSELLSVKIDRDENYQSPNLIWAAKTGQEALVRLLLNTNVEIDAKQDGLTALHWATRYAHGRVAAMIASRAECVNTIDELGCTPLHWVARNGLTDLTTILLDKGADHNALDNEGMNPLDNTIWQAFKSGNLELSEIFLTNGFDVDTIGPLGMTALHFAAGSGSPSMVHQLLRHGADISAADEWGWTPLHTASSAGHDQVVAQLLKHGADRDAKDVYEWLPVHLAAAATHDAVVRVLTNGVMGSRDVTDYPREEKVATVPLAPKGGEPEGFVIRELMSL
ncbi:ankyrin repeat-containing domain protein [Tuber indicum]|nr:ankyrin repeat-containing domain protein [Tuber indicum]